MITRIATTFLQPNPQKLENIAVLEIDEEAYLCI